VNCFFVFEVANISLFPGDKKVVPVLKERRGIGEGKVDEVPELNGEVAFKKKMSDSFRGCETIGAARRALNSPFEEIFNC
jgi:hypothetical protein